MAVIVTEGRIILVCGNYPIAATCKGVSPSPANLHRVKKSYVAVTTFYRDGGRRCIEVIK